MKIIKTILTLSLCLIFFCCDRIKNKGNQIVDATKDKIDHKKHAALDKITPTFNSYTPDTKFNKKRFEEFFGFTPTPDVSEIYCFADQIGIDSKFMFSFKCNTKTKDRIVKYLNLKATNRPENFSTGLWQSFPWWDSSKIVKMNPFLRKSEHQYYKYLWFDNSDSKLYFMSFDM